MDWVMRQSTNSRDFGLIWVDCTSGFCSDSLKRAQANPLCLPR